jgi:hypothetical protein
MYPRLSVITLTQKFFKKSWPKLNGVQFMLKGFKYQVYNYSSCSVIDVHDKERLRRLISAFQHYDGEHSAEKRNKNKQNIFRAIKAPLEE